MNRNSAVLVVAALIALAGCQTVTPAGYYWGNYSKTLYAYTKSPSQETLAEHTAELQRIIEEAQKRNLRVPPGIHAELGYIEARRGDSALAMAHYQSEMQQYPESRAFVERLSTQADPKQR